MKKTILALVLVISLICAATVPAYAAFVDSTTLSTAIEAEVTMQDATGNEVVVESFVAEDREAFEAAETPAIIVTAAAEADEEVTPSLAKVVEAVAEAESIEEVVEALALNAEEIGVTSDYAVADIAYVEANQAMLDAMGAEAPVVTVEVEGITADSEVIVVFVPDDPAQPRQAVKSTVNEDGTVSFAFMENGTYMFLVKVK